MSILDIMRNRHSVRQYLDVEIETSLKEKITQIIDEIKGNGLDIQVKYQEKEAFTSILSKYGNFVNAVNYLVISSFDDEKVGYYGEKIVLKLQELGLGSCWVVASFKKGYVKKIIETPYPIKSVIAFGYPKNYGYPHVNKPDSLLLKVIGDMPPYTNDLLEAVKLAPTAINQQKFLLVIDHGKSYVINRSIGVYQNIDLGIVKCHLDLIKKELGIGE